MTTHFEWPREFARIPDLPWARGAPDTRGLRYHAMGTHRWYRNLDPTVRQLGAIVEHGDVVVDYSGGTGLLAERIVREIGGVGVVIAEPSPSFLSVAVAKLGDEARIAFRNLPFVASLGRLERLDEALGPPMVARGVDVVVSTNAVHLYPDLADTARSWHRCLRPGGRVLVQSAEIDNPAAPPGTWLITRFVTVLAEQARRIVTRDERFAAYRWVLDDAGLMETYERLWRRIFLPVKPLDAYVQTLQAAGFVVETTTTTKLEVGVAEWCEAATIYPDLLAWVGGSEKVGDPPPTLQALADRTALMKQAVAEIFGTAVTFDACWTYLTCRRP